MPLNHPNTTPYPSLSRDWRAGSAWLMARAGTVYGRRGVGEDSAWPAAGDARGTAT